MNQQNPFVSVVPGGYCIGFSVPQKPNPLWWIGTGFKNLAVVRRSPETFATKQEAETKIQTQIIKFISEERSDDFRYVHGWDIKPAMLKFTSKHIHNHGTSIHPYSFSCNLSYILRKNCLISDQVEDNYAVENILQMGGIIDKTICETDSESCEFHIYFKTQEAAELFVQHLNRFIEELSKEAKSPLNYYIQIAKNSMR